MDNDPNVVRIAAEELEAFVNGVRKIIAECKKFHDEDRAFEEIEHLMKRNCVPPYELQATEHRGIFKVIGPSVKISK